MEQIENNTNVNLNQMILLLGTYFFLINVMSKKKYTVQRTTRNPHKLKVGWYTACMIKYNDNLGVFKVPNQTKKLEIQK